MRLILATAAGLAIAAEAAAEPEWYGAVGYTAYDSDEIDILSVATFKAGVNVNANFGVELEYGTGIDGVEDNGVEFDIKNQVAGYVVARYPVADQFEVFGRLGYGTLELEASGFGASADESVDGFGIGVGGEFDLTDRLAIRTEYTRFEADDDIVDGGINTYAISIVLST